MMLETSDVIAALPARPDRSHKGTFGRVLVAAGSPGMAGASYFAALAAYRVGAGLVEILAPEENRIILQTLIPEAIVTCYGQEEPDISVLSTAVSRADAVVIGPGLGHSRTAGILLGRIASRAKRITVLDADGLNLLAGNPEYRNCFSCPLILTPHAGEAARLLGSTAQAVLADTENSARQLAEKYNAICVLKDARTVIAAPDGTLFRNPTGNHGMATGGAGDVLTGVIAGLAATDHENHTLSPVRLAALGVWLHGSAGDLAAARLGAHAVMASDIAIAVGEVIRDLTEKKP